MSGWEATDTEGTAHWAVLFGEDYSIRPDAVFPSKELAEEYCEWKRRQHMLAPDEATPIHEWCILQVRDLHMEVWNSFDPVPAEGSES